MCWFGELNAGAVAAVCPQPRYLPRLANSPPPVCLSKCALQPTNKLNMPLKNLNYIARFRAINFQSQSSLFLLCLVGYLLVPCISANPSKINWHNPCNYSPRNRTSRDIRKQQELKAVVNMAYDDFVNTTQHRILSIYGNSTSKLNCRKKSKPFTDKMSQYYKDFQEFGRQFEKMLSMKINSSDNVFSKKERQEILINLRDRVKGIMCEMYDVFNFKYNKEDKNKKGFDPNKKHKIRTPFKIPTVANITRTTTIDICVYENYKHLISAFNKFLRKKNKAKKKRNLQDMKRPNLNRFRGLRKARKPVI